MTRQLRLAPLTMGCWHVNPDLMNLVPPTGQQSIEDRVTFVEDSMGWNGSLCDAGGLRIWRINVKAFRTVAASVLSRVDHPQPNIHT